MEKKKQTKKGILVREHPYSMKKVRVIIELFIAMWALSDHALSLLLDGYATEVPIAKYFFTVFRAIDGWGIEKIFVAVGLGVVFYMVRDRQKNPYVTGLSAFFAVCTTVGISYANTDSWDCIFLFRLQFVLALFVTVGYFFLYKNCILFLILVYNRKNDWFKRMPAYKAEKLLFERYAFAGPFLFIVVCGFPWLVFYFPGTLQWDAHAQLWQSLGVINITGHFPVFMTELMGSCIRLGRLLFQSDTAGVFLFTGPQFLCQSLVFSYAVWVMGKCAVPVAIRWGSLIFWAIFPYFPLWGYTMVKDSYQYICVLLLTVVLIEILYFDTEKVKVRQTVCFLLSVTGITISRNDGCYVVLFTMLTAICVYRRYWKLFASGALTCILLVSLQSCYMSYQQIPRGEIGEMLSIPLQQTARYLRDHFDEVTEEEAEILQEGFQIELEQVASHYNPMLSDGIKANFVSNPDAEYMKKYFWVWCQQFLKHPDTYIQAFLNQTYGYFYPNVHNFGNYIGIFYLGNTDHWQDGHLDIAFAFQNTFGKYVRRILEQFFYLMERLPVVSMLLSPGMYVYILLGQAVYLLERKARKELLALVPMFLVLAVCIASPVNAYLRYLMPLMAAMPMGIAWCDMTGRRITEGNST